MKILHTVFALMIFPAVSPAQEGKPEQQGLIHQTRNGNSVPIQVRAVLDGSQLSDKMRRG